MSNKNLLIYTDVETILKTGIIDYKMMKFYPMAVQSKTGIIGVDRIKVEFDLGSDDNTQIQEKNDDEMGIDLESFEYIIDSCQYPFYLFDFNVNLLNEFKNKIKTDINSSIKFRDDRKLVIECKQEQLGESYESWTRKVAMVLEDFSMKNCAIFEIKNFQDENLRVYIRDKAIGFFSESKDVSLVYKNEPNAFIRIEGDFNSIELAKSKLIEEIESFNKVIKNELNLIDKSHATVF